MSPRKSRVLGIARRLAAECSDRAPAAPCLVCARLTSWRVSYVPDHPMLWGAPWGKDRIVLVPLCHRCADGLDAPAFERALAASMRKDLTLWSDRN